MPGTTRYSATFDRTYQEDESGAATGPGPPVVRRPRSQSLQVESLTTNGRRFSTQNGVDGQSKGTEFIPTRSAGKPTVSGHNNPFQFVKVGTCPLYKKAEDQLKKAQVKIKPPVVKEDEEEREEWQSNLDSWKSRRRKMSEGAFLRQEEIKKFEEVEQGQSTQQQPRKTKTFSEMIESRAHRGRAVSLCLFSNPLESADWIFENGKQKAERNNSYDHLQPSEESAESSNINSEDDNEHKEETKDGENNIKSRKANGHLFKPNGVSNAHIFSNSDTNLQNSNGGYIDSGLESLSSSHRTGDIQDSGSDFSQDSGSSIGCDSPRVSGLITSGIELLEEFNGKENIDNLSSKLQKLPTSAALKEHPENLNVSKQLTNKGSQKQDNLNDVHNFDVNRTQEAHSKSNCSAVSQKEKSIESENEMYVDDFEELERFKSAQAPETNKNSVENVNKNTTFPLIEEVPIEKVTEEMERLILEQLEEEERTKEMLLNDQNDTKTATEVTHRRSEPPKEKPPPPPIFLASSSDNQKNVSVKRVNSTKRILREINKRRSNFLGIDNSDEEHLSEETLVPPPPALEDLLRDEREQDLLRQKIIMASVPEPSLQEEEIAQKEREIIENLEKEEQMKSNKAPMQQLDETDIDGIEEEQINLLKQERKCLEDERLEAEQKIRMEEARLLQKREEQVRKQEADNTTNDILSSTSVDTPCTNPVSTCNDTSASSVVNGDGKTVLNSGQPVGESTIQKVPPPPPPKPIKRKEALRKERERLRLEQEALQHEREEHRRQLQLEQEQLMKILPKTHVPDTPISRVGPPPTVKPTLPPQLTIPSSNTTTPSQVHREDHNQMNSVPFNGQQRNTVTGPSHKIHSSAPRSKASPNQLKSQKVPSVRKQADTTGESRYNQNHWLIQEAEMRRIVEQTERQRSQGHGLPSGSMPYLPSHASDYPSMMRPVSLPIAQNVAAKPTNYAVPMQLYSPEHYSYGQQFVPNKKCAPDASHRSFDSSKFQQPPAKPSRVPEKQEQMLSVSGRKRCSHCGEELGRGAAMIIESLQLYYHIQCFLCCVCQAQLGNGSCGTDVRVRNNKLHCHNCYSNDEAGLKFSQV